MRMNRKSDLTTRAEGGRPDLLRHLLFVLVAGASLPGRAETPTFSEQLLQSYFDTAGVCTTSSIDSIIEGTDHVTVNISIQAATAKALLDVSDTLRDDWFSLHCPPEIHGVWRQPQPPGNVLVSGAITNTVHHALSCRRYLQLDREQPLSIKKRIKRAVDKLFGR